MKFTIEVEEFWLDSDSDLEPALKKYITQNVQENIWDTIKDSIGKRIKEESILLLKAKVDKEFKILWQQIIEKGEIKDDYSDKMVSYDEYIKRLFNTGRYNSLTSYINDLAKKYADELKKRYDLQFATVIVKRLGENGLLKDEATKLLLNDNNG